MSGKSVSQIKFDLNQCFDSETLPMLPLPVMLYDYTQWIMQEQKDKLKLSGVCWIHRPLRSRVHLNTSQHILCSSSHLTCFSFNFSVTRLICLRQVGIELSWSKWFWNYFKMKSIDYINLRVNHLDWCLFYYNVKMTKYNQLWWQQKVINPSWHSVVWKNFEFSKDVSVECSNNVPIVLFLWGKATVDWTLWN